MAFITKRINILKLFENNQIKQLVCSSYMLSPSSDRSYNNNNSNNNNDKSSKYFKYIGIGAGITALIYYNYCQSRKYAALQSASQNLKKHLHEDQVGMYREDLPDYSIEDVMKHSEMNTRVWVTYKCGVYDITDFIKEHPGGDQIMMAAGSSLDPFWLLYGIHKTTQIHGILEKMRIGNVSEEVSKDALAHMTDPYALDPKRHKVLRVHTEKPFNGEPPAGLLTEQFYTPNDIFYVRNHLAVPDIDLETYELEIEIENTDKIKKLSFADILKLPKYTVSATLMCAGNRRSEMNKVKEVKGLNWGISSIGNATWTGARLVDVLKLMGVDDNTKEYSHVHFEGMDMDTTSNLYTASIPLSKAVNKDGDVLLAYEMNGQPIPRDHGFPIRVIVPGTVGARNVKWLGRILIAKDECQSHWQQKDYKGVPPSADPSHINLSKLASIQELPVISAICKPSNEEVVKVENGFITVKGYAWSGGGRKIIRVDLTTDGGKEWHVANFAHQTDHASPRHWSWTLWTARVPVAKGQKTVEIWVKAIDSSYNSQPDTIDNIWNYRGFLNNAYHRIQVNLKF